MSEGHGGSGAAALEEDEQEEAQGAVASAATARTTTTSSAPGGGEHPDRFSFDDGSTVGSADAGNDSWLRDGRDGQFYCPRHPDQRRPYRPHRNSICAECLLESQRSRKSLEHRKRVVEEKLQRLLLVADDSNDDNRKKGDEEDSKEEASGRRRHGTGSGDAPLLKLDVMKDWTNTNLPVHHHHAQQQQQHTKAAGASSSAEAAASGTGEGATSEPAPPPTNSTAHYEYSSPPPHPQPPAEPQQPAPAGCQPHYEYYAYSQPPASASPPYYNGLCHPPSLHHPHGGPPHPSPYGSSSDAPPYVPAPSPHPAATYATAPPPPEYAPHPQVHVHPSYPHAPPQQGHGAGWAPASVAAYGGGSPAATSAAAAAPAAAASQPAANADAFAMHLFHMMERQDAMLVQKIGECDALRKALDGATAQIRELRVDNAQLRERIVQQGDQMRHELDLIRREVVGSSAEAIAAASSANRPQHVHRTAPPPPSQPRRVRRDRGSSGEEHLKPAAKPRSPLLLTDSPHAGLADGEPGREVVGVELAASTNEAPFRSEQDRSDLSWVKLEPRRWESLPSRPDLSPPAQWFPFQSENEKGGTFPVLTGEDDVDFHDPFAVGAVALNEAEGSPKVATTTTKAAPAPPKTSIRAASAVVAASPREDIDWERSELAV